MVVDRRVERTRHALYDALVRLILARRYDDIAINDIVAEAGVGRSTFYDHFRSKDDLLASSLKRLAPVLAGGRAQQERSPRIESCHATLALLRHMRDHKAILTALEGSSGHDIVVRGIERQLTEFLGGYTRMGEVGGLPRQLVLDFLGRTFVSVSTYWLARAPRLSPEEADAIYHRLIGRGVPDGFFVNGRNHPIA